MHQFLKEPKYILNIKHLCIFKLKPNTCVMRRTATNWFKQDLNTNRLWTIAPKHPLCSLLINIPRLAPRYHNPLIRITYLFKMRKYKTTSKKFRNNTALVYISAVKDIKAPLLSITFVNQAASAFIFGMQCSWEAILQESTKPLHSSQNFQGKSMLQLTSLTVTTLWQNSYYKLLALKREVVFFNT